MTYTIKDQDVLKLIHKAYIGDKWPEAYKLVFDEISQITIFIDSFGNLRSKYAPRSEVDENAWVWIKGAREVNTNSGAFGADIENADYVF